MISPPLPASLVAPFFEALDENEDGHIDFKELSCGMSAACRGPEMERQKCKIFLYINLCNNIRTCSDLWGVSFELIWGCRLGLVMDL